MNRGKRINDLVEELLDTPEEERAARLAGASTQTREEVHELLTAHGEMGEFLAKSAPERLAPKPLAPGAVVGSYTIVRVLGAGGGGTVYEAEQESPRRRVALKTWESARGSEASLRRFRDEAEILARLQHPDVAHVYEAGVHEGRPYFVLEYVPDARTLTEHAVSLDRDATLRLLIRVCEAVHHGHLNGVVHREFFARNHTKAGGTDIHKGTIKLTAKRDLQVLGNNRDAVALAIVCRNGCARFLDPDQCFL